MDEIAAWKVERPDWWPDGPWMTEPDRVDWKTEAGFPGMILRTESGHLCGYVAVPPGHPAYGHGYSSRYEKGPDGEDDYSKRLPNPCDDLSVHGGITYASKCSGRICHVPAPGEPEDVWWLGFDCAHCGDWSPSSYAPYLRELRRLPNGHENYRDINYVRGEVESLARQLAAVQS